MLSFITNVTQFVAASSVISITLNWRNEDYSWQSILHNTAAGMLNYYFFSYSKAVGRMAAETAFPLMYGASPSVFSFPSFMDYQYNKTMFIDYAIDFAPYVILPIGFKISSEVVKYAEKTGIKLIQKGFQWLNGEPPVLFSAAASDAASPRPSSRRTTVSPTENHSGKKSKRRH